MAIMKPHTCRAARALLEMPQQRLAELAGVSFGTLRNFEDGKGSPLLKTVVAIQEALEAEGVEFLEGGAVRLKSDAT